MTELTTSKTWSFSDLVSGANTNANLSLDIFKLISDKSADIGSLLGMMAYFYYEDRRLGVAFNRSLGSFIGILSASYFGFNNVLGKSAGVVGGAYVSNMYYLESYFRINTNEMIYLTGSALIGGYVFKYLYDNFIYNHQPQTTA